MSVIDGGKTPWYAAPWPDDLEGAAKDALEASGFAAVGTFKDEDPEVDWSGVQTALDEKNTWGGFALSVDFEPLDLSKWLNMLPQSTQSPPYSYGGYASGGPTEPRALWDPQPHQCPHCFKAAPSRAADTNSGIDAGRPPIRPPLQPR